MFQPSPKYLPWQLWECAQCGADIVAPEWAEHPREACAYRFVDTVYLSREASSFAQ